MDSRRDMDLGVANDTAQMHYNGGNDFPPENLLMGYHSRRIQYRGPSSDTPMVPKIKVPKNQVPKIKCTWAKQLNLLCLETVTTKSYKQLLKTVEFFERNMTMSAAECFDKRNRSTKFFGIFNRFLWALHSLRLSVINEGFGVDDYRRDMLYMNKMTIILGHYIDIELSASKRNREPMSDISFRIMRYLDIFMGGYSDWMVNVLLRSKTISMHKHSEITTPIFEKLLVKRSVRKLRQFTYARRLLAFKLWKMSMNNMDEKNKKVKLAMKHLRLPGDLKENLKNDFLKDVFPEKKFPCNFACFVMRTKINIQTSIENFFEAENKPKFNHSVYGIFTPAACSFAFSDNDELIKDDVDEDKDLDGDVLGNNLRQVFVSTRLQDTEEMMPDYSTPPIQKPKPVKSLPTVVEKKEFTESDEDVEVMRGLIAYEDEFLFKLASRIHSSLNYLRVSILPLPNALSFCWADYKILLIANAEDEEERP